MRKRGPFSEIRWAWRLLAGFGRSVAWCLGTGWLGARVTWRATGLLARLSSRFRETLRCPRGHETPAYGVFECRCGSVVEGWAFGRCPVCGLSAGWTPCRSCGLSVRNPLR